MSEAKLIKIDRNGSKHYEGKVQCDRCGGHGYYAIAVCNGQPVLSPLDAGVCWKCGGNGWVIDKWIERTPEYQAKLDARKQAKREAQHLRTKLEVAKIHAERAERKAIEEAARAERAAQIAAEKAASNYVGEVGQKLVTDCTFIGTAHYERRNFLHGGMETVYIHMFRDRSGNKIIWRTSCGVPADEGQAVRISAAVKEHSEYKDEKQTVVIRCKIERRTDNA